MVRVRILTGVSGEDVSYIRGDEVDLPAAAAAAWCEAGMAELVRQEQAETPERGETPETTTAAAPRRTGRARRKEAGSDD